MPSQYGHTNHGINIANYRLLSQAAERKAKGYRTPYDWAQETHDHVGLSNVEQKNSTTLRHTSSLLQATAADQVANNVSTVEEALKTKISATERLRDQLQQAVADVMSEIEMCVVLRASLEERLKKVQAKQELNNGRLQVRDARPTREKTMDDVERHLLQQQQLMGTFIEKVKRAMNHVDREVAQLEGVKAKLTADLRDKMEAIEVDSAVLRVGPEGGSPDLLTMKRHDCLLKTPHTWSNSTEDNLALAHHWLTDAARLRKAIRHAIYNARNAEHETASSLNTCMMSKLGATHHLKNDLERQLTKVREEQAKAAAQRKSLSAALEAKRGPLAQAKERFALRKARPCREFVADDVEAALGKEIAHLNAVTSQLSDKVNSVDKEIGALELTAAMIEDNIRDKDAALSIDERMVLMDGRINLSTPPPSSVASYPMSQMSTARTQTLRRIAELESELLSARREREALESTIGQFKSSLRPLSPAGVLSPKGLLSP